MSTKSNPSLNDVFEFNSIDDKFKHDAEILMFRFLSEIEKNMEKEGMNKKELAKAIGTSSSFITQLFRGHKLINLITLAKIQNALKIKFKITSCDKNGVANIDMEDIKRYLIENPQNYKIYYKNPVNPGYEKIESTDVKNDTPQLRVA